MNCRLKQKWETNIKSLNRFQQTNCVFLFEYILAFAICLFSYYAHLQCPDFFLIIFFSVVRLHCASQFFSLSIQHSFFIFFWSDAVFLTLFFWIKSILQTMFILRVFVWVLFCFNFELKFDRVDFFEYILICVEEKIRWSNGNLN